MTRFPRRIYCRREPDGRLSFSETLLGFRGARAETIAVYLCDGNEELTDLEGVDVTREPQSER